MPSPNQLPFQEAIDYFAEKVNIDTDSYLEAQGIAQTAAFTVAAAKGQLLQDIRDAVGRAINDGLSLAEFMPIMAKLSDRYTGDKAWKAQLIYEQNLRQAYGAGRYSQMTQPSVLKSRPYWTWKHGDSRVPRPTHKAMDGKVFEAGSLQCFPPCGFNCRCQIFSLSQREVDREGLEIEDVSDFEADEGFNYLPGKLTKERKMEILKGLSPDLEKAVLKEAV